MANDKHWNYRVMRYAAPDEGFGLHEVHYLDGEVVSWTERPIVVGSSRESIEAQLSQMRVDARRRPVLDEPKVNSEKH
jgi:hypothetical protein